jgi:hypothetical protein
MESISQDKIDFSMLFDSLEYVTLETTDDVLIKELTRVKYFDNKIFILDKTIQSLFAFDMDGKLIWKIHNFGEGPREYSQLTDFGIDENNHQLFLFSRLDKIQIYDLDGNFVDEDRIPLIGNSFTVDKDRMYLYTGGRSNWINNKDEQYNLLIYNKDGEIKGEIPLKKALDAVMIYNSPNSFCKYENEIRFFMPFSNNIYSIQKDSVYIKYHFDFGDYNLPDNYFNNHTTDDLDESKYAYGLNSYCENREYCSFEITLNGGSMKVLYAKKEKKIYLGLYDNVAYCFPTVFYITDSYMVGARYAEDLFREYNHFKEKRKNTMLEKVISEITEDDNPVIFFCYFK